MTPHHASRPGRSWPTPQPTDRCPCLSGEQYGACCGPFHSAASAVSEHRAVAPTAERLMRSRYSAFVVGDVEYLLESWHPSTRPVDLELDPAQRWLSLEILGRQGGGMFDNDGTVHFRARWVHSGERGAQEENSRFQRVDGRWLYVDAA